MKKSVNLAKYEAPPRQLFMMFTYEDVVPLVANALDSNNYNIVAWSGSSRFLVTATGLHTDPEMSVIYPKNGKFTSVKLDWAPILMFGEKCWPWNDSGGVIHDSILEMCPGDGDSVWCLYQRWRYPVGVFVPVQILIKDMRHPEKASFIFLKPVWSHDVPRLSELLK